MLTALRRCILQKAAAPRCREQETLFARNQRAFHLLPVRMLCIPGNQRLNRAFSILPLCRPARHRKSIALLRYQLANFADTAREELTAGGRVEADKGSAYA